MVYKSKLADLKFNLGTLIAIKAKTGKDPLTVKIEEMDTVDTILFVKALFESACVGDVPEGFDDLTFADLTEIVNAFVKAYSVPGEVNPDTQQGQAAATY